jgi:putative transposase
MARLARVVVPGLPHHVTQRGNRQQATFFSDEDYAAYRDLVAEWCARCGVEVWAYCLLPNHVHLVAVPEAEDSLRRALGEAHRRYTRRVNFRESWRGHLWQGRFASFPMDHAHLSLAVRHVELNPVRARLVRLPHRWRWSSAAAHLAGRDDPLVRVAPLLKRFEDWRDFLAAGLSDAEADLLRRHERTGRPLGSDRFLARLEALLGRLLGPQKRGPKGPRRRRRGK